MERQIIKYVRDKKTNVCFGLIGNCQDQKITVDKIMFVTKMSVVHIQMR